MISEKNARHSDEKEPAPSSIKENAPAEVKLDAPADRERVCSEVGPADPPDQGSDGTEPKETDELSAEHRKMLSEESGISDELIETRGYRTVTVKAELEKLGFSRAQRNVPGLLIPIHSPAGEIANYQHRPDEPRIKDGKPVKYETPHKSRMVLDVPPLGRGALDDPNVPLFVTEGIKKGDALASQNLCAVGLIGVWNWRGTNEKDGKVALPEWDQIALNGRQAYIVFDSDVMLKPGVHAALARLKGFLESRKAVVAVIYLPPGAKGQKQGVDDFLAAGGEPKDLLACATTELRRPPEVDEGEEVPETQSAMLAHYAEKAELFHAPDGTTYITIPMEVTLNDRP